MSTLATFVSTLGFKMDGSFDKAMQDVNKRLGSLGNSFGGVGGQLSKSLEAASKRLQAAQMNMQAQAMKSEAAKMAMSDKRYASELKRINSIKDSETRLSATKALNAERERAAQVRHENTMAAKREGNLLKEATLKLRERQQSFREEQAHIRRTQPRGSGGAGLGAFGGIPVMGRTTLGMLAGGYGVTELVRQSYQMAQFEAKTMPTLKFITGSDEKAKVEKSFIDDTIKRLSLDRITGTKSYTDFAANAYNVLGSKGTQDLFEGAQQIGIMTGRSAEEMHRAMNAFSQIKSCLAHQ